ncbi:MAG: PDZ domain-containing protein, partial [Calditrichaeota bacterium]
HSGPVLIYLTNPEKNLFLSMIIGGEQALSIYYARNDIKPPRPMTHDLISKLIDTLNYHVDYIKITGMKEDTYYAAIYLRGGGKTLVLDARPSDAIALALRQGAAIYSNADLLKTYESHSDDIDDLQQFTIKELGITVQKMSSRIQEIFTETRGLIIAEIKENSLAEKSELEAGDILTGINGYPTASIADLKAIIDAVLGEDIVFDVVRNGQEMSVTLDGS